MLLQFIAREHYFIECEFHLEMRANYRANWRKSAFCVLIGCLNEARASRGILRMRNSNVGAAVSIENEHMTRLDGGMIGRC